MMQNNNSNNYPQEDKIDLKKLFKFFNNSKKLIITITLVITTLGVFYSSQVVSQYHSTALIEIGNYKVHNSVSDSIEIKLIEPIHTLIQAINSQFIHKKKLTDYRDGVLQLVNLEDRLLRIIYISPLSEKNEELINKVVIFIENRHLELQTINTERVTNQFYKLTNLNNKLEVTTHALVKELLELEFMIKHNPTNTKLIGEIVTEYAPKTRLYIFLSFVLGLLLSIVIATMNNSLKVFKEE